MSPQKVGSILQAMTSDDFMTITEAADVTCNSRQFVLEIHAELSFLMLRPCMIQSLQFFLPFHQILSHLHGPGQLHSRWLGLFPSHILLEHVKF